METDGTDGTDGRVNGVIVKIIITPNTRLSTPRDALTTAADTRASHNTGVHRVFSRVPEKAAITTCVIDSTPELVHTSPIRPRIFRPLEYARGVGVDVEQGAYVRERQKGGRLPKSSEPARKFLNVLFFFFYSLNLILLLMKTYDSEFGCEIKIHND